jgi:hypothetical protein
MKRDVITNNFNSSFLAFEKDIETILRKLFIESNPYSEVLKRLLVINTKDCLDNADSPAIKEKLESMSLAKLRQEGYIKLEPKIAMPEHEEVKAYIIMSCDNFTPNDTNTYYRDCTVSFDIICHLDYWDLGNYRIRPLKIAGYIDGILNEAKLSGIGTFNFLGCSELVLNEDLAGYTLIYRAVHGNDDKLPRE